jgi:hypothetical protein
MNGRLFHWVTTATAVAAALCAALSLTLAASTPHLTPFL